MNNENLGDPLTRYAKVNTLLLDTYDEKCLDACYDNTITSMKNTSWDGSAAEGGDDTLVL
jgi:hypothetical protein